MKSAMTAWRSRFPSFSSLDAFLQPFVVMKKILLLKFEGWSLAQNCYLIHIPLVLSLKVADDIFVIEKDLLLGRGLITVIVESPAKNMSFQPAKRSN